ncbi:MAG: hypothetical protein U9R27_02120, partial [Campylobacterota bacterium]|nr:hypothetical protein [Campylobacterota bacterium]
MDKMTKEELDIYRKSLLKQYHAKKEDIDYANDELEEEWIEKELEEYRIEIKACVAKLKELSSED